MSHLIRIYTVFISLFGFLADIPIYNNEHADIGNGKVHFVNLGWKVLREVASKQGWPISRVGSKQRCFQQSLSPNEVDLLIEKFFKQSWSRSRGVSSKNAVNRANPLAEPVS